MLQICIYILSNFQCILTKTLYKLYSLYTNVIKEQMQKVSLSCLQWSKWKLIKKIQFYNIMYYKNVNICNSFVFAVICKNTTSDNSSQLINELLTHITTFYPISSTEGKHLRISVVNKKNKKQKHVNIFLILLILEANL